ncbi:MAG: DUF6514 family protein [Clostridiales bacterium]|nr:DUF6514 family protein [Clostridiales bacterium]
MLKYNSVFNKAQLYDKTARRRIVMIEYYAVKESLYREEIGAYTAYGIGVFEYDGDEKKTLQYIPDVFLDEDKAEQLVDMCNRLQLEPVHLLNVVEDTVSEL